MDRDDFRFRGGRLCLDLTATLARRYRDSAEQLALPGDLVRWYRAAGLPCDGMRVTAADLGAVRALREAAYRLLHPARREHPDQADIDLVNRWAALPDPAPRLAGDARSAAGVAAHPVRAGLSAVARDVIDLLCGEWLHRVRECDRATCSVLFLDTSRPGQRRWCDMAVCGNQVKASRHRRSRTPNRSS